MYHFFFFFFFFFSYQGPKPRKTTQQTKDCHPLGDFHKYSTISQNVMPQFSQFIGTSICQSSSKLEDAFPWTSTNPKAIPNQVITLKIDQMQPGTGVNYLLLSKEAAQNEQHGNLQQICYLKIQSNLFLLTMRVQFSDVNIFPRYLQTLDFDIDNTSSACPRARQPTILRQGFL